MTNFFRKIASLSFIRAKRRPNVLFVLHNRKQVEYVLPVMEYLRDKAKPIALFTSQSMAEPKAQYVIPDDQNIDSYFESAGFPYREMPKYSLDEFKKILNTFDINRILLIDANTRPSNYIFRDVKTSGLNIPIISQQRSVISPESLSWYGKTWGGDVVAAHSEFSKIQMVSRRGVDPSIIHVTGSPNHDAMAKMKTESDGTILFIGQNNFNAGEQHPVACTRVTDLLCSLLLELPDNYRVLIKEHPNVFFDSSFEPYLEESLAKKEFAHLRNRISRVLVADTIELMRKASLISTIYSNCGLEALVMNKPAVILNINPHAETLYGDSGIITEGADDFVPMCLKALCGETDRDVQQRFVNKMLLLDGKSSQRIGDLISDPFHAAAETKAYEKYLQQKRAPLVSVVMPAYNEERFLRTAIDSILNQTFSDFELILINDGSTDRTKQIIDEYDDPRLVPVHRENIGMVPSFNDGIRRARGKYIARMDSDDISFPDRFKMQVEYLEKNPDIAMVTGHFIRINEHGEELDRRHISLDPREIRLTLLLTGCKINHPSVMIRADVLRELNGYDEAWRYGEDHELWLRLIYSHRIGALDEYLVKWRIWSESYSIRHHEPQQHNSRFLMKLAVEREGERYRNRHRLYYSLTGAMRALLNRPLSDYGIGMSNLLGESARLLAERDNLDQAYEKILEALRYDRYHWGNLKAQLRIFLAKHRGQVSRVLLEKLRNPQSISYPEILTKKTHERPRMLFFTIKLPYPVRSGSNARTLSLLKFLSTLGYDIVLVYPENEFPTPEHEEELLKHASCLYRMKYHQPDGMISHRISNLLHQVRLILGVQTSPVFDKYHFRRILRHCNYETVLTNYFFGSRWIGAARRDTLRIVDTHDIAFLRAQRKIQLDYHSLKKGIAQALLTIYRRCELHLYNKFDRIIAISPHDYSVFEKSLRSSEKLVQAQIPVDLSHFSPGNETEIIKDTILFIGTGNLANTDAFRFFVTEIFPLIRRELPAARFSMAGNKPSREQIDLANITENVEVLGFQKDLREQYKSAEVVVCPLRIGSGMKVKVIEAAAMGKAVVMTSVAAEGIPMRNGEECVIADDPEEFAAAVVDLLRSEEKRRAMGGKARTFVERNFDASIVFKELEDVLMKHFAQSRDMQKSEID